MLRFSKWANQIFQYKLKWFNDFSLKNEKYFLADPSKTKLFDHPHSISIHSILYYKQIKSVYILYV